MKPHLEYYRRACFGVATAILMLVAAAPTIAQTSISLKKEFVEEFKNRVTIDTRFIIDKAHAHPNSGAKDGDMHVAGRSPADVGLATVAEIMNAKEVPSAVQAVHDAEGTGQTIEADGVWRLWPEHGGEQDHRQFSPLNAFTTTNPPHVFEIHPVTKLGSEDVLATLHPDR